MILGNTRYHSISKWLIETTALVNECYSKFVQRESLAPSDRSHFRAHSATVMPSEP